MAYSTDGITWTAGSKPGTASDLNANAQILYVPSLNAVVIFDNANLHVLVGRAPTSSSLWAPYTLPYPTPYSTAYAWKLAYGYGALVAVYGLNVVQAAPALTATLPQTATGISVAARDLAGNQSTRSPVVAAIAPTVRTTGQLWPR